MTIKETIEVSLYYAVWIVPTIWLSYWIKKGTEKVQCGKCESYSVVRSKRRYYRIAILCLYIVLLSSAGFYGLTQEPDADIVVLLGFAIFGFLFTLFVIRGLYFFIRGLLLKKANYKCLYCENSAEISL